MVRNNAVTSRRKVLKSTTGLGVLTLSLGSGAGLTAADSSKFEQGTVRFVEVKEEYVAPPDASTMSRTGTAGYAHDQRRGILTLTNAPVSLFREHDTVIAAGGNYYAIGKSVDIRNSERSVPIDTDYRQLGARYATADQVPDSRPVRVKKGDQGIQITGENIDLEVSPEQEVADSGKLESAAGSTVTPLERKVEARNHGEMAVFGHEDFIVLPMGSKDSYAQARVESLLALAGDHASEVEGANLIAVPTEIDITKRGE